MDLSYWKKTIPVAFPSKQQNFWVPSKEPRANMKQEGSRPELCISTDPLTGTQKLILRIWTRESCVDISAWWGGLVCDDLGDCPIIIDIQNDIIDIQNILNDIATVFVATAPVAPWSDWHVEVLNTGGWAGTIYYSDGTNVYTNLNTWGWAVWVIYTDASWTPVWSTTGFKVTASQWAWADHIFETTQTVDASGDTTFLSISNWTFNIDNSTVNSTDNTYNNDGDTVNNTNVTQNYIAPTLISCQSSPSFGGLNFAPVWRAAVEVKITVWSLQYTQWQAISLWMLPYTFGWETFTIDTWLTISVVNHTSWWAATLDSVCFYTWLPNIINHDWTITNNNNTTTNNTNSTINNTNTTYNGWTFNDITINNATFTGNTVIAWALVTDYISWFSPTTVYPLSHVPSGTIQVSVEWGVIQVKPTDYSHTDDTWTFVWNVDFSWYTLIVTYIKWVVWGNNPVIADQLIPLQWSDSGDFVADATYLWTWWWKDLYQVSMSHNLSLVVWSAPVWYSYVFQWLCHFATRHDLTNWTLECNYTCSWALFNAITNIVSVWNYWSYFNRASVPFTITAVNGINTIAVNVDINCEAWTTLILPWGVIEYFFDWIEWYLKLVRN